MTTGSIWDRFSLDPRQAENAHLRASDRDRDAVNDLLGTAYAEGRLSPEELDERADRTARAKTLGELPPIISDLVSSSPLAVPTGSLRVQAEQRYRQQRQNALYGFLTPSLICWAIWAATMFGGFPWPVFVMIGTGMRYLQLTSSREDAIGSIERDLERRERRRLENQRRRELRRRRPPWTDRGIG